jgi:predicted ester cyclase
MSEAKQAIEQHVTAFNAHDFDADPWSSDAEVVAPGGTFRGREEISGFFQVFWQAFPDARLDVGRLISEESSAAAEGSLTGTHSGVLQTPNGEVPPTGRQVELRWVAMYETRGDEILSEHLCFDQVEFLTQLGLMPGAGG